jgi:hypothetical protein
MSLTPAQRAAGIARVKALFDRCAADWPGYKKPEPPAAPQPEPKQGFYDAMRAAATREKAG